MYGVICKGGYIIKHIERNAKGNNSNPLRCNLFNRHMLIDEKFHGLGLYTKKCTLASVYLRKNHMIKKFLDKLVEDGWTQKEIAEKIGIAQQMVSRFLQGKECTLSTAWKVADAFNLSLDEVVGRNNPEKKPISNSIRDHKKGRKLRNEI